eukprot:403349870
MEWKEVLEQISEDHLWMKSGIKDIPLYMQNGSNYKINRVLINYKITTLPRLPEWKMNLMVVSEKYGLLIVAVNHELYVYKLDPVTFKITNQNKFTKLNLQSDEAEINNIKLITCNQNQFIVTVDNDGHGRMFFLENLDKDPIKFNNVSARYADNSCWSVDGSQTLPPRVVVGSNTHNCNVYDLSTGDKQTILSHTHNVPSVAFSPCGKFFASTSIDKQVRVWESREMQKQNDSTAQVEYRCARQTIPSQDWGWAVQWINKNQCQLQIQQKQANILSQPSLQRSSSSNEQSIQRQTNIAIQELIRGVHGVNRNELRVRDAMRLIQNLQSSRQQLFQRLSQDRMAYEDELLEEYPETQENNDQHGDDSFDEEDNVLQSSEELALLQAPPQKIEQEVSSAIVEDKPVEAGSETSNEQLLDKYLLLHCAKLELSVIDVSSGKYFADQQQDIRHQKNPKDFMKIILKQYVQNQMYFEDLQLNDIINMRNYSRYLFLEFIEDFSLLLVGNQGAYDLHLFKIINFIDDGGNSQFKLQREYVYKGTDPSARILGISVVKSQQNSHLDSKTCRIYILDKNKKLNVLEIRKNQQACGNTDRSNYVKKGQNKRQRVDENNNGYVKYNLQNVNNLLF